MPPRKTPPTKKATRAAAGGIMVAGAFLLFLLFRGPGIGVGGDGKGEGDSEGQKADNEKQKDSESKTDLASVGIDPADPSSTGQQPTSSQDQLTLDEQVATGQTTLGILIDERSFLLRVPGKPQDVFRTSTLERLVKLAQLVPGDTNGIRVTILRRETARTTAEQELKRALLNAGITENAIYMPNDFVP